MPVTTSQASVVHLVHEASGASAAVHLYGATVTSFVPAKDTADVLFVSKKALLDGSKPIRGGIPLVFPQFGAGLVPSKLPSHGFARTSTWTLVDTEDFVDSVSATFVLATTKHQLQDWPHAVRLVYTVTVAPHRLTTSLAMTNTDTETWGCQALLHTYLRIPDAAPSLTLSALPSVHVTGLQGLEVSDKVTKSTSVESRAAVAIAAETDSVYKDTPARLEVQLGAGRTVRVEKRAFLLDGGAVKSDAVVWNPWTDKAKGLSDFGDDEYPTMLCVEPGVVTRVQPIEPAQTLVLKQVISHL
ncbi:Aste57867_5628 [Aphanomyces stellatus]|uniref:glucose-6-phosphate 1-epimerase n=1 Tax=Aphanomyces stellatus TaxID=120398 RepID=A0A485KET4_9STRA|nr:hypothetical protein As57867_005615 [Aphanomyces stellatus]VFT82674.1 Aste57867_5628 [Aphanomyces stellatus]